MALLLIYLYAPEISSGNIPNEMAQPHFLCSENIKRNFNGILFYGYFNSVTGQKPPT